MRNDTALQLMELAGFTVHGSWETKNMYWGRNTPEPPTGPWWLVLTEYGIIRLGWRKRVLEIEWSATKIRGKVTEDDVTKEDSLVHAWNYVKGLEYLTALRGLGLQGELSSPPKALKDPRTDVPGLGLEGELKITQIYDESAEYLGPSPRFTDEEKQAIKASLRKAVLFGRGELQAELVALLGELKETSTELKKRAQA